MLVCRFSFAARKMGGHLLFDNWNPIGTLIQILRSSLNWLYASLPIPGLFFNSDLWPLWVFFFFFLKRASSKKICDHATDGLYILVHSIFWSIVCTLGANSLLIETVDWWVIPSGRPRACKLAQERTSIEYRATISYFWILLLSLNIIIKALSKLCWGQLHEFWFAIPVYPRQILGIGNA